MNLFSKKPKEDPLATLRQRIESQQFSIPEPAPAQEPVAAQPAVQEPAAASKPRGSKRQAVDEIWAEAHPEDAAKQGQTATTEGIKPVSGGNGKKNGNGSHYGTENPIADTAPMGSPREMPGQAAVNKDDLEAELRHQAILQEMEQEAKIPGNGWLFNIKDKHLPEATVLDRGEVLAFALGNMQENMLLGDARKESLFMLFEKDVMRMNVSVKGLAREQGIMARQQDADKAATLNTAKDLMGRPGAV